MTDLSVTVSAIEQKIGKLIGIHRQDVAEIKMLRNEVDALTRLLEEQKNINKELENKLNILKTVKTIENKEGTAEAKAQVNRLLREIDKCIGLLNV
ncbi:MAG TPA: hypothetical protein PKJ28_08795 [Bacteroidales bacterium]|nr:hypothetical protein [Bacteroidales bacterium]HPS74670.1 hypothetical protein [Bacteroidales bacterium]